jgi:hypothetical protein
VRLHEGQGEVSGDLVNAMPNKKDSYFRGFSGRESIDCRRRPLGPPLLAELVILVLHPCSYRCERSGRPHRPYREREHGTWPYSTPVLRRSSEVSPSALTELLTVSGADRD